MTSRSSGLHSEGSPRKCGSADPSMRGLVGERNSHSREYAWYEVVGPLLAPVQTMVAAYSCRSSKFGLSFIPGDLVGSGFVFYHFYFHNFEPQRRYLYLSRNRSLSAYCIDLAYAFAAAAAAASWRRSR